MQADLADRRMSNTYVERFAQSKIFERSGSECGIGIDPHIQIVNYD